MRSPHISIFRLESRSSELHLGRGAGQRVVVPFFVIQKIREQQRDPVLLQLQRVYQSGHRVAGIPLGLDEALELLPVEPARQRSANSPYRAVDCRQIVFDERCLQCSRSSVPPRGVVLATYGKQVAATT